MEKLLILHANRSMGFMKSIISYLIFTQEEIIVTHIDKETQKIEIKNYKQQLKDQGKGFIKSTLAMIKFWDNFGNRYFNMEKENILIENQNNFSIPNTTVEKLVFKALRQGYDETSNTVMGDITIKTSNGKYKFSHNYDNSYKQIKVVLTNLFGKTLKYKR